MEEGALQLVAYLEQMKTENHCQCHQDHQVHCRRDNYDQTQDLT